MIFWAKIDQSAVSKNPQLPKYVFSSGGADKRSRGFALFHKKGKFVLRVVTASKKWRLKIENGKIPFNSWFSFAFTWKKGKCFFLTSCRVFLNCFLCLLFTNTLRKSWVNKESSEMMSIRKSVLWMERRLETSEKIDCNDCNVTS